MRQNNVTDVCIHQPLKLSDAVQAWVDSENVPNLFGQYIWSAVAVLAAITARLFPEKLQDRDLQDFVAMFPGKNDADVMHTRIKQAKEMWSGTADAIQPALVKASDDRTFDRSMLSGWTLGPRVFDRAIRRFKDTHLSDRSEWKGTMLDAKLYLLLTRLVLSIESAAGVRSEMHAYREDVGPRDYKLILEALYEEAVDSMGGKSVSWRLLTDVLSVPLESAAPTAEGSSSDAMPAAGTAVDAQVMVSSEAVAHVAIPAVPLRRARRDSTCDVVKQWPV